MRRDGAYDQPRLYMAGETLLIVEFGAVLSLRINQAVITFDHYLQANCVTGLLESLPTNNAVALRFDPLVVSPHDFRNEIKQLAASADWFSMAAPSGRKRWQLPVCYGGEAGPDLASLSGRLSVSQRELVAAHGSDIQRVFMIGFAPGFLYTGMLPKLFDLPRREQVRPVVPAGSVSVAIGQSVISSTPAPTGWHVIGRTPLLNFAPHRDPAVLIKAGDEIRFCAIEPDEYRELSNSATAHPSWLHGEDIT